MPATASTTDPITCRSQKHTFRMQQQQEESVCKFHLQGPLEICQLAGDPCGRNLQTLSSCRCCTRKVCFCDRHVIGSASIWGWAIPYIAAGHMWLCFSLIVAEIIDPKTTVHFMASTIQFRENFDCIECLYFTLEQLLHG